MKKFVLLAALSAFSFNSFAQFSLSCPEIYVKVMQAKEQRKERIAHHSQILTANGILLGAWLPPVGMALLSGALGGTIYGAIPAKETKVLDLAEGDRQLERFTKSLQKNISSDISENEVMEIIKEGIESGHYCRNFPDLANRREVKRHVRSVLSLQYANRQ